MLNLFFIFLLALTSSPGEGVAMLGAFSFVFITGGALFLILIELIALAIAEHFPKAQPTADS